MECEYGIYRAQALGVVRLGGIVTGTDIVRSFQALYDDRRWAPGYAAIWDARAITELVVSPADVQAVLDETMQFSLLSGAGEFAVIVKRGLERDIARLLLLKGRMNDGTVHKRTTKIFWSVGEALKWMRIHRPPIEILRPSMASDTWTPIERAPVADSIMLLRDHVLRDVDDCRPAIEEADLHPGRPEVVQSRHSPAQRSKS